MAQETLNAGSVGSVNAVWADEGNITEQYDVATATITQDSAGDYSGDANLEDTTNTPTAVNAFKIIYWNSGGPLDDDDVFDLQFYDLDTTSWISLGGTIAETETEYVDGANLTAIQAKFAIAANKKNWVNAFSIRWFIDVVKGAEGAVISTQGIQMEIEYTAAVGNAGIMTTNTGFWGPTY